ncbi:unnamed protein product [Dracunculus medinensis]|uniref:Pre-rRNA-processing protein TSR1 homolog n=1 Tax=Dracunculus medinensis TaxID=318479 RepID=A0A158Q4N8_DRAME|nr:unnamed protein product [Dracunculus medinensis]
MRPAGHRTGPFKQVNKKHKTGNSSRFKCRFMFAVVDYNNFNDLLCCIKVSDVVAFLWPLNEIELNEKEEQFMSALLSHGLPSVINFVPGLGTLKTPKDKEVARKNIQNLIFKWSFGEEHIIPCDSDNDGLSALRLISNMKKKPMNIQLQRSYLFVENYRCSPVDKELCDLDVFGYIRGRALNVNDLVHLQGCGDFQLKHIAVCEDPILIDECQIILKPDPLKQQSLQSEIEPDPMNAEQTWPDENDLPRDILPEGTSEYQAAWIFDGGDESENKNRVFNFLLLLIFLASTAKESEPLDLMGTTLDMDDVEKYRRERENAQFPDEIDTPIDKPARIRFQKYRALKSFRTSFWDPMENLPHSYSRIFKFSDYKHSKKVVMKSSNENNESSVSHGSYVMISIAKVPTQSLGESPLVIYGLLPHEQKMSVVNMVLRKHSSCTVPILNKQKLLFYVGYRIYKAQPVFSQHTNGDKFKMERFMPSKGSFITTLIAPITFPPSTVLVFAEDDKDRHLVATGSVLDVNPDRIILKRVVLSGHPFKISQRTAVVRYMFFNREDIEWFKPVELYSRGRRGTIKEAIGTHGYMKCVFDHKLSSMDTVMMNLYKRVFPKWTYQPFLRPYRRVDSIINSEYNQMEI